MAAYNSINLFDILPNTIWTDIYKQKSTYNNLEDLYNLNSETRDSLLYMIKFGHLKLFYGIVYSSGNGEDGQLGDGKIYYHEEGTPIPINTVYMDSKRVIQVSAGISHSLFLCEDGSVYSSGHGQYGQLEDGITDYGIPMPIDTSNMNGKRETGLTCQSVSQRVIQVSAGSEHSLFLCEDGSVYASGGGQYGILGDGRTYFHSEGTPIPINTDNMESKRETGLTCQSVSLRVIQVSAGDVHSLFLCEDGSVYASGNGDFGELGDGRTDKHDEGTPIPIDTANMDGKRVIQVSAGSFYSLFLCKDGSVYASGNGEYGRLGDGRTDGHNEGTPIPIDTANIGEKRVIQVSAGVGHSLFLCEDGSVYASGNGQSGRLGDGRTDDHNEGTPIQIDTSNIEGKRETGLTCQSVPQRVIQVSANSGHSLFLCEDGSVYASGEGNLGRLGDGRTDRHDEGTPIPINTANMNGKSVIQVSAGNSHSLFLI